MPTPTTIIGLRKPLPTEAPDAPGQIGNLADDIDTFIPYKTDPATKITSRWNGTAMKAWDSDWATVSGGLPTSGIGVNYTTCQTRYRGGKLVVRVKATIASVGSGSIQFTLPSGLDAAYTALTGNGYISKSGTKFKFTPDYGSSSSQIAFRYQSDLNGGTTIVTVAAPVTIAVGDEISFMLEADV